MGRRKKQKGTLRQTVDLFKSATTPALIVRSLKTTRQAAAGGTAGTGTVAFIQQLINDGATNMSQVGTTGRNGLLVTIAGAIYAFIWSWWENVTTAVEKMVNDTPPPAPLPASAPAPELFPPDEVK